MKEHSAEIFKDYIMISKVELGSVNSKNITPSKNVSMKQKGQTSFTGLGSVAKKVENLALKGIQNCEEKPMINVAVLDLSTAILPRTFFETFIGSKEKDENGKETKKRKLNLLGGFEALRREGSGLLINCIIPSYVVYFVAKLLNRPVMGAFNKSNLTKSWANSDTINQVQTYFEKAQGKTKEEKVYSTLRTMFDNIEGIHGDIKNPEDIKHFKDIFANDQEYDKILKTLTTDILSDKPKSGFTSDIYKYIVSKSGVSENIRFNGDNKFLSSNLSHLCNSVGEVLHGAAKEGLISDNKTVLEDAKALKPYIAKAKRLVNAKSLAGLGLIIPLAISAQPINRWITHKLSGKKGAPIYNDDKERILTPDEKKKLTAQKFLAVPLMWGVAGLSMLMDRPSLKMFQFKNIFPTMDQARIISAATFSSRLAAAEDSNELGESTIRDIATFSSFYFLGDYAAKGIATYLEKHNKDGIKLINRLYEKDGKNALQKFWNWAKHTKMKSTDELSSIANEALRTKAKNLRALCQLGNLAFSLISLGVFIPIYTRTQVKRKQMEQEKSQAATATNKTTSPNETFTQNLIKDQSPTFKSFFGNM